MPNLFLNHTFLIEKQNKYDIIKLRRKMMRNYFIIHGSFGSSKEHFIPWLKAELEKIVGGGMCTP